MKKQDVKKPEDLTADKFLTHVERRAKVPEGLTAEEFNAYRGCLEEYKEAFSLLQKYDEDATALKDKNFTPDEKYRDKADDLSQKSALIIRLLMSDMKDMGLEGGMEHFGVPRAGAGVDSVIRNVYQTAGGADVYPSVEKKAAHLLYFLVKNHLFIDGNKRIASFLFVWFLDMHDALKSGKTEIIPYYFVYALSVFIAQSDCREKDAIIGIIESVLLSRKDMDKYHTEI